MQEYSLDVTSYGPYCSYVEGIVSPEEDDMTVGIGVICDEGDTAIIASDTRVTYGTMKVPQHEYAGKQYDFPPFNFAAAIAGSTSSTHEIVSEFSGQLMTLLARKQADPTFVIQFEHLRNAIEIARKKALRTLQACTMESDLGCSLEQWLSGKLPSGLPFNEYAHREGLRILQGVKNGAYSKMAVIVAGFLRENPIFLRGLGASPVEESATPAIFVIGGKGAVEAQHVLNTREQSIEHGIARTLLHIYEALRAATQADRYVGTPSSYVIIRPRTARRPNGVLRMSANHPLLVGWAKKYKQCSSEGLDSRAANDLAHEALFVARTKISQWLGPQEMMVDL